MPASKDTKKQGSEKPSNGISKLEQKLLPVQAFLNRRSELILFIIFLVSNLILIAFSCALIGLLNNRLQCEVEIVMLADKQYDSGFKPITSDPIYNFTDYRWLHTHLSYYKGNIPIAAFPKDRQNFWAIMNTIFIAMLITSITAVATLGIFLLVKKVTSGVEGGNLTRSIARVINTKPKMPGISRTLAFIGSVLQIFFFCCLIPLVMATIIQANFAEDFTNEVYGVLNETLVGRKMPYVGGDYPNSYEFVDLETVSSCWVSVYNWLDEDAVGRVGLILMAVAAFELMSIFASASLMQRPTEDDENPLINTTAEQYQHDNPTLQNDEHFDQQPKNGREIEMKQKMSRQVILV